MGGFGGYCFYLIFVKELFFSVKSIEFSKYICLRNTVLKNDKRNRVVIINRLLNIRKKIIYISIRGEKRVENIHVVYLFIHSSSVDSVRL